MSELVLKIPTSKLPFLGVTYNLKYHNAKVNEDLVNDPQYSGAGYELTLEFIRDKINIKLMCKEHIVIRHYPGISYDADKFKWWHELTKQSNHFNFGHVTKEHDKEVLMKTTRLKPLVFKIIELKILSADRFFDVPSMPFG